MERKNNNKNSNNNKRKNVEKIGFEDVGSYTQEHRCIFS